MPQREYTLTIARDGSVELHIEGHKGKSCLDVIKVFEQIVGPVQDRRETSEFYEPDEQVRHSIDQRH